MGKHKKVVDCSACSGKGGKWGSDDGNKVWQPCILCNGSGKQ